MLRLLKKEHGIDRGSAEKPCEADPKVEMQGGVVRLANGLSLKLSDEANVDYSVVDGLPSVAE